MALKKYILWAALLAVFILTFSEQARSQSPRSQSRGFDLGLGFGKTGIGKGYSVSSAIHLFPRGSIYPLVRCSWTGKVDVSDDRSIIAPGDTGEVSGSQCGVALGADLTLKRWKRWEAGLSAENGFQKTTFHYHMTTQGEEFSGIEKHAGYYFLPAVNLKYWFSDRSNFFVTAGAFAYGDPTGGDGLGRTVILAGYTRRFDLAKIGRFFKKR